MALTEERRAALLAYCRIEDPTADDLSVLELLYDGAVGYLENAGVSEPAQGTPRRRSTTCASTTSFWTDLTSGRCRAARRKVRPSGACSTSSS